MQKLALQKILALGQPNQLVIRSLSCGLYRVEANLEGHTYILADHAGGSLTFRSTHAVREYCEKLEYLPQQVYLHQNTTYGEMIGIDGLKPEDTLLPLSWAPDH